MKKSRLSETQVASILKQGGTGASVRDLCRQARSSTAMHYQWKSK